MRTVNLAASLAALSAAALFGGAASAIDFPIKTDRIVNGVSWPTAVVFAPGDSTNMYIVEKNGLIRIFDLSTNTLLATPFLDIVGITQGGASQGDEQGLLGLAFDPNFETNGYFYINHTAIAGGGDTYVRRYTALSPTTADPASALTIITFDQPFSNHNGGWISFGPDDGYLYISTGDGGSANDPGARAQDITDQKLGKMLRLDVSGDDFPADPNKNYKIPPTNPFAGPTIGDDEILHYGLRNPWRCSWDRLTGDLWIGDVGQNAWEEIDFVPAGSLGLNFGWRCTEGNACTGLSGCTCNGPTLTKPVHVYDHGASGGPSVTGGMVYRGCAIPEAQGHYFFSDYGSGKFWSFRLVDGVKVDFTVQTSDFTPSVDGFVANTIVAYGVDPDGELYVVDHGSAATGTNAGQIFKVIRDPNAAALPDCDSDGTSDSCAIAEGAVDCDSNAIPDSCDISSGNAVDCNDNGAIDECEIDAGQALDCNGNGLIDGCEVAGGTAPDCNLNGIPDSCDIASGAETDSNGDGIPDSCQPSNPADLNGDGVVDGADLGSLLAVWGECPGCPADFNGDGVVDGADLGFMLANWG